MRRTRTKRAQVAKLHDWHVQSLEYRGKTVRVLKGWVEGHPQLGTGVPVRTSIVTRLDRKRGFALTLNTYYKLGREVPA